MPIEPRPLRTSSPLPPYRAVLAVDAEKFTSNAPIHQQVLSSSVESVLEEAFRRSDLAEVWQDRRFPQSTGDGYVIGVEPQYLPFLVYPLLNHLQETLEDAQPGLAAHDRELRLRLRASIDVGPLPDSQGGHPLDGIGRAMNDTHRLLDSTPVRTELRHSDLDITLLVAIISRRVYEEAVLGGFVGLRPPRFRRVNAELAEKNYSAEGYLYVPTPSRRADDDIADPTRPAPHQDDADPTAPEEAGTTPARGEDGAAAPETGSVTNRIGNNSGQAVQAGTIRGGVRGDFRGER